MQVNLRMGNITGLVSTQKAMAYALRVPSRTGVFTATAKSRTLMAEAVILVAKAFSKGIDWCGEKFQRSP